MSRMHEGEKWREYAIIYATNLRDESHIIWLDVDIYRMSPRAMIAHSSDPKLGLVIALCNLGDNPTTI
jgi:hypothetical protein